MADRRKRTCPNPECEINQKNVKVDASELFCKKCGTPLVLVCRNKGCYHPIEDRGPKHTMCERCEAEHAQRIENIKEKASEVGKKVVAPLVVIGPAIVKKVSNDETKKIVNHIAKNAEIMIDKIPDKAVKLAKDVIKKG